MSQEIVLKEQTHSHYIDTNLAIIANQSKLNEKDLAFFAIQCKRTGLDPITRQIYALPIGGKLTIMASIDGLRLIAERSGKYEGQTTAMWCGADGKWVDVWLEKDPPKACKVGVFKNGFREALFATALFSEYAVTSSPMWKKMPALMLSKVAESLALRKAFPNEMSGIYSENEMDQAGQEIPKDVSPQEPKKHIVEKVAEISQVRTEEKTKSTKLAEYVMKFGKDTAGKKIREFDLSFHKNKVESLNSWLNDGKPLKAETREYLEVATAYIKEQSQGIPDYNEEETIPV